MADYTFNQWNTDDNENRKFIDFDGYHTGVLTVGSGEILTDRRAYDSNNLVEYIGWARPGTATSEAKWKIIKYVYVNFLRTETLFADGDAEFDNVWDNHASLSYS